MRTLFLCLLLGFAAPAAAQNPPQRAAPAPKEPAPKPLSYDDAEILVRAYGGADTWTLKAMVLLSLGTDFPPNGAGIVTQALRDKDDRLAPHAVELLLRMPPEAAKEIATPELVGELVERTAKVKHKLLRARALEALALLLPDVQAKDQREWLAWWTGAKKTYAPLEWVPPPKPKVEDEYKTTATVFVERAFDLRDAGLDVAIVIDSTGSMQVAIDTARDAVADVVTLLANIAPKLRLGLVEYKELGEIADGAQVLVPLTRGEKAVQDRLARLVASGGGDMPERVEKGIEAALSQEMGWNKDANRLILVIGDAPPHAGTLPPLLELVKRAHDEPFAKAPKPGKPDAPRTGGAARAREKEEDLRPFITSTIYTSAEARTPFEEIAKAGGGAAVHLALGRKGGGAARPAGDEPAKASAANAADPAVRTIVEHIMLLSFGQEHRARLALFVRTFFEYLDGEK